MQQSSLCKSKSQQWEVKSRVTFWGCGKMFLSNRSYMENQEQIRWIFIIQRRIKNKWWFEDVNYEGEWQNPIPFKECLLQLPPYFHTHTFSLPLNVKELGKRPHAQKLHMDTYPFFNIFVSSGMCRKKMAYRTNYLQRHILLLWPISISNSHTYYFSDLEPSHINTEPVFHTREGISYTH